MAFSASHSKSAGRLDEALAVAPQGCSACEAAAPWGRGLVASGRSTMRRASSNWSRTRWLRSSGPVVLRALLNGEPLPAEPRYYSVAELIRRRSWPTRQELRSAVFDYVEAFYNRERRHSTLGYLSPAEFEEREPSRPEQDRLDSTSIG